MSKLIAYITAVFLVSSAVLFSEESTLRLMEDEVLSVKQLKCVSCGSQNPVEDKYCGACGLPIMKDNVSGNLFFKAGGYIPTNSFMMNDYGTSVVYGVGLNLNDGWLGLRVEFENYTVERLIPLTTIVNNTPALGDWRSATTKLSVSPVWVSVYASSSFKEWKGIFGIGGGMAMVREEYRGDYYFKANATAAPDWGYASSISRENLWCAQAFLGIIKSSRIGFDVKLTYIPSQGRFIYSDLGGISTTIGICF